MWAQLIIMRLKPGKEEGLPRLYEQLRSAEQPGSGLLRSTAARDDKDPSPRVPRRDFRERGEGPGARAGSGAPAGARRSSGDDGRPLRGAARVRRPDRHRGRGVLSPQAVAKRWLRFPPRARPSLPPPSARAPRATSMPRRPRSHTRGIRDGQVHGGRGVGGHHQVQRDPRTASPPGHRDPDGPVGVGAPTHVAVAGAAGPGAAP